jgi:hypothetical protein
MKRVEGRLRTWMGMFTVNTRVSAVNVRQKIEITNIMKLRQMIGMVNTVTMAELSNG